MVLPVLLAGVVGLVAGAWLVPAEAQRNPTRIAPAPKDCAAMLAYRDQLLTRVRRAERMATRSDAAARAARDAAEAEAKQLTIKLRETEVLLANERRKIDQLTRQLGPLIQADDF